MPTLVTATVKNLGPRDVSVRDFEGGSLEARYSGAQAVGVLSDGNTDPDAWVLNRSDQHEFGIELRPRILKAQESIAVTVLCDGMPKRTETIVRVSGVDRLSRHRRWMKKYGWSVALAVVVGSAMGVMMYWALDPSTSKMQASLAPDERLWISVALGGIYIGAIFAATWARQLVRKVRRIRANKPQLNGSKDDVTPAPDGQPSTTLQAEPPELEAHPQARPAGPEGTVTTRRSFTQTQVMEAAALYQDALARLGLKAHVRPTSRGVMIEYESRVDHNVIAGAIANEMRAARIPIVLRPMTGEASTYVGARTNGGRELDGGTQASVGSSDSPISPSGAPSTHPPSAKGDRT